MVQGQRAIEQAKVRTYHETGRLIREHVLLFKERADYGTKTIAKLAADVKVDRSVLHRCVRFFECFPIVATWPQLSWAHFRELIPVADAKERRALATEANRNAWPVARLAERIRETAPVEPIEVVTSGNREPADLLVPQRGTPGLHRVVEKSMGLSVDLGFKHYWRLTPDQAKRLTTGDIVRIANDDSLRLAEGATKAGLFTYAAELIRVVDGDTLVVALEISPGVFLEQTLRLRGLDCPEMSTPAGRAAKRFVDALFARTTAVVIHTTKPDKYDRYLAEVFLRVTGDTSPVPATPEIFLNNALLENGHAVRYDGEGQKD